MSTNPEARAWVGVRADALLRNLARVREAVAQGTGIIPMVKADAYGLGVREAVRVLEGAGPWGYGVATVEEGVALRGFGVERPILVASPTPPDSVGAALAARLQLSVSSLDALRRVARVASETGAVAEVHTEVDTGMGRSGFDGGDASAWLGQVAEIARGPVRWVGCATHMHSADEDAMSVEEQWRRFEAVLVMIPEEHRRGLLIHALNSAGTFRVPQHARAAVRPGIFLYGGSIGEGQPLPEAVASIHARVVHVRDAAEGATLGYGATYRAEGPERWATLSIGYGDGLPRALGNRGSALLAGARVPIIGRVSMDVTVVNLTGVGGVGVGDIATLLGAEGGEEITVDEVAELAGTISYEVLTGLTGRLPRVWKGGDGS